MSVDPVSLAITAAMMAASMAVTAMQKFEGQRLDDPNVTLADYGTPWPRFWGQYRFDGCPILWAEELREEKETSKTKGGKFTEYKYFGTWMVGVAGHEIDAVSRIWFDKHLVFQAKAAGPISPIVGVLVQTHAKVQGNVKLLNGVNMAIHLGTEDQMPDPRYEAWCEDKYGPNSAPAFRGRAVIYFKEIPLEKFGMRIPQVAVEAISAKADAFPYELKTSAAENRSFAISPDGQWLAYYSTNGTIEWWDVATRTKLGSSSSPFSDGEFLATGSVASLAFGPDGTAHYVGVRTVFGSPRYYVQVGPLGAAVETLTDAPTVLFEQSRLIGGSLYTAYADQAGYLLNSTHSAHALRARDFCEDDSGAVWGLFQPDGSSDSFTIEQMALSPTSHTFAGDVVRSDVTSARIAFHDGTFFIHGGDGFFYVVDAATGSVISSGAVAWGGTPDPQNGGVTFWVGFDEYSLEDGSLVRSLDATDWVTGHANHTIYDPLGHAIWGRGAGSTTIAIRFLDRVGSDGVSLSAIATQVGDLCAVGQFDTSAAAAIMVEGWSTTQGAGRDVLEPLFTLHDCILAPHDFGLRIVKLGGVAAGDVLATEWFAAGDGGRPFEAPRGGDTDLPQRLTVNFRDKGKDLQPNNVTPQRNGETTDSKRERSIDMTTYVSTPPTMQKLGDRVLRRMWNERGAIRNGLTEKELALEIGDVRELALDSLDRTARCAKITWSAGVLKCEWKRDHPSLATLSTGEGAEIEGSPPDAIYVAGPSKVMVLDIALTADAHDSVVPLLYYGAGRYAPSGGWPGATIEIADADGDEYSAWNSVDSSDGMTWGYATDVLANANPWLWDRGSSVNVRVLGGTLSSVTEAAIDADPSLNLAYLGGELLNFATATLEADGTYTLSGFKRGRRGTEWACASHAAGEEFVLAAGLQHDGLGLSEVGTTEAFRGTTLGRDPASAPVITMTFTGAALKPRAPVIWRVEKDAASGDITITIRTRTRVGGSWNGAAISTGETIADHAFDVYDGATFKRTLESAIKTFTYSAADQVSDHGAEIAAADLEGFAYQLSASVGRGFARAA